MDGAHYAETGVRLGQGGLGRVDAVLDKRLGREVARKELLDESPGLRMRFLREARVTAQLEHPAIVPVYELGQTEAGRAYYTMRRIRGQTLGAALRGASIADRLALLPHFVDACQAMAYAHARGVVHRDLKPDNIMVGQFGETVVVDWGLAKVMGKDESTVDATGEYTPADVTRVGAAMGTPAYMSPEQARGDQEDIDARSDVWGLGAILFELLAGRPPFDGLDGDTAVARLRQGDVEDVRHALDDAPPDLAAVVHKALQVDPAARYEDAAALADDIVAWQRGGLVAAYRYSTVELLRKTVRRNASIVAVASGALVVVAIGAVASFVSIGHERDRAVDAEARATSDREIAQIRLARSLSQAASHALAGDDPMSAWVLAVGSLEIAESPEARGALIAASEDPFPKRAGDERGEACWQVAVSPTDGAVACSGDSGLRVWAGFPGAPVTVPFATPGHGAPLSLDWNAAGTRLVEGTVDDDVWMWTRGDAALTPLPGLARVETAVFLPDESLAVATGDGRIGSVAPGSNVIAWSSRRSVVQYDGLAPAGDGTVFVGALVGPAQRWNPRTDAWSDLPGAPAAQYVASSTDGRTIALAGQWGGSVSTVRIAAPDGVHDEDRIAQVVDVAIAADGNRVAVAGKGGAVVWDGPDWRVRARVPTDSAPRALDLSGDGRRMYVAQTDGAITRWDLPAQAGRRPVDKGGIVWDARFVGDGSTYASGGNEGVARVWDAASGDVIREIPVDPIGIGMMGVVDRDAVAALETEALVRFGLDDGAVRWRTPFEGIVNDIQPGPDGSVAVATYEGAVALVSADGKIRWRVHLGDNAVAAVFDEHGELVVSVDASTVWLDAADGHELRRIGGPDGANTIAPLADGGVVVSSLDMAQRFDKDGRLVAEFRGQHEGRVIGLAVSPSGDHYATGGTEGRVCIWKPDGTLLAAWTAHAGPIWRLDWSKDGRTLLSAGADGEVHRWNLDNLDAPVDGLRARAAADFGLAPGDGVVVELPN